MIEMQAAITRRDVIAGGAAVLTLFTVGGAASFLGGGDEGVLRPPGAQDESRFLATCLKCNRCLTACPQACLRTGVLEDGLLNWRTPIMDFHRGACDFCGECEQVCPSGAIRDVSANSCVIGTAVVDEQRCLAWAQSGCRLCVDVCPYEALSLDSAGRPVVDEQLCNGCGLCEYTCPSNTYRSFSGGVDRGINVRLIDSGEA